MWWKIISEEGNKCNISDSCSSLCDGEKFDFKNDCKIINKAIEKAKSEKNDKILFDVEVF